MDFRNECDHNGVREGMIVWLFQYFMDVSAEDNLQSRLNTSRSMVVDEEVDEDTVSTYPETLNCLLRTYAIDEMTAKAYHQVISMNQGPVMM